MELANKKFLGIDYGQKKIGLALADSTTKIATPYKIIANDSVLFGKLRDICKQEGIGRIIIGVPLGLKGIKSKQYEEVLNFISQLEKEIQIAIEQQDENLSSRYAQSLLQETKAKGQDDAVAAMIILQSYLDERGRGESE